LETTIDYEVTENGTYYVYAKDAYNHVSHEKIVIDKIDGTIPVINTITNSSNGEWTNKDVTITIDAVDNETSIAKYQTKSSKTNNVWTDLTGNTDTFTTEINESVYYRVIDKAGNISKESITVVKIDKTAPSKPAITNSKENTWTGSDLPVTLTSTDSSSGIDHYEWYENGAWTTRALTTTGNTGSITYTVTRNETIRFRAIDKAGNISEESTTVVKIDKDKPTQNFSIASSTSGNNGWYKALSIKASVSDSQSGVSSAKYCITTGDSCTPSTNASLSSNTFTIALETNSSAQKVCVNTTDNAGNVSNTGCTGTYKVDTTNPTAKISTSVSGSSITINASGSSDSGSGIATYYYSKDGGSSFVTSSSSSYTFTGLSNGTYTLVVKVLDKSGRMSNTVSTSNKIAISQNILGRTINYGWTLSGFQWENYASQWQLYGGARTTTLSAISDSTYNLSLYNTINVDAWMYWNYRGSFTYYIYVCSTKNDCTQVSSSSYDNAIGQSQSQNISANISGYNGNYYIKISVSKYRNNQANANSITLNP
uniref:PKD domain-containing protein n=2 Tax=Candidatus Ventrenecus sp. TaxID=3085654 RepID=UPI0040260D33